MEETVVLLFQSRASYVDLVVQVSLFHSNMSR